ESFETRGDFEGAAREFISIARQFPNEKRAALSAADNLAKIGQPEVAAPWFESALELIHDPDEALKVANRLSDIYLTELKQPAEAREVLEEYLERFPQSEYADSVQRRVERLADPPEEPPIHRPVGDSLIG
ncbi:MAG TPA: tetratricopeptide repeat protein, partial [Candidatus Hydrogenedentes bacterium]|nr:tetratricopeptide repeat protein [Candidatus Hydrogenedentota bacterium]